MQLRARAFAVATMGFLAAGGGCGAMQPLPELEGGTEIALKRGSAWNTYKVKPPYIIGPRANLQLRKGRLSGSLEEQQVSITVSPEGLSGQVGVPARFRQSEGGSVEIDIESRGESVEVSGLWGGTRVHFTITPESLRGTITGAAVRHCQYVLDKVAADGTRSGTSICAGLPEETLLEFPNSIQKWLSRNEIVAVLLILLASPPTTSLEDSMPISI